MTAPARFPRALLLLALLLPHAAALGAAGATKDAAFVQRVPGTDVSFAMLPVPAGTFRMGSPGPSAAGGTTRARRWRSLSTRSTWASSK